MGAGLSRGGPLRHLERRACHEQENTFWLATLHNLAARFDVDARATMEQTCVDRRRQWSKASNIRHNAAIRSGLHRVTHPRVWFGQSDAS